MSYTKSLRREKIRMSSKAVRIALRNDEWDDRTAREVQQTSVAYKKLGRKISRASRGQWDD